MAVGTAAGLGVVGLIKLISALVGAATAVGGTVGSAASKTAAKRRQDIYARKLAQEQKERERKEVQQYNKDVRKSSISRAIGSTNVDMPSMKLPTQTPPVAPDDGTSAVNTWDAIGGVGQGVAQLGSADWDSLRGSQFTASGAPKARVRRTDFNTYSGYGDPMV